MCLFAASCFLLVFWGADMLQPTHPLPALLKLAGVVGLDLPAEALLQRQSILVGYSLCVFCGIVDGSCRYSHLLIVNMLSCLMYVVGLL